MAGAPEAMEIERQFLQALGEADGFRALGSELALTRAGNDVARFRRK
jgi:heat shock protein HslJ